MTTTIKVGLIGILAGTLLFGLVNTAFATQQEQPKVEQCGEQTTSVPLRSDFDGQKVDVDFQDYGINSYPSAVTVTAESGYKLVKVLMDVDGDGHPGYWEYPVQSGVKFNPNPGTGIDAVKVTVEKTCTPVCTDPEATNVEKVVEGETIEDNSVCKYPQPETPTATPSAPKVTTLPDTGLFDGVSAELVAQVLGVSFLLVLLGTGIRYAIRKRS